VREEAKLRSAGRGAKERLRPARALQEPRQVFPDGCMQVTVLFPHG
jgi:hypothetical protein